MASRILRARAIEIPGASDIPQFEPQLEVAAVSVAAPELGVPYVKQDGTLWCWAAVSLAYRTFVGRPAKEQCVFVADHLHLTGCCPPPGNCNRMSSLPPAVMAAAGVGIQQIGATLNETKMRNQLGVRRRPVACFIDFPAPKPDHFVVVDGITGSDFIVKDSARGRIEMRMSTFATNYANEGGQWADSFVWMTP